MVMLVTEGFRVKSDYMESFWSLIYITDNHDDVYHDDGGGQRAEHGHKCYWKPVKAEISKT